MANDRKYLSAEEEAKLLKPIDEYIGKIQKKIDALRVDGSDKVQALKTHICLDEGRQKLYERGAGRNYPAGSGRACKGKSGGGCKQGGGFPAD